MTRRRAGATHDATRYARLRRLFSAMGVAAIESDADLDGGYLGDGPDGEGEGLPRALHVPFTFAASGRNCPLKAGLYPEGHGFTKVAGRSRARDPAAASRFPCSATIPR